MPFRSAPAPLTALPIDTAAHRIVLEGLERVLVVLLLFAFSGAHLALLVGPLPSQGHVDASPDIDYHAWRLSLLVTYAPASVLILTQARSIIAIAIRNPILLLLLILFPLSALWSVSPDDSVRRGLVMLITGVFGIYMASRYTCRQMVVLCAWALGCAAVLSMMLGLLIPDIGIESGSHAGQWRGAFIHRTRLGLFSVLWILLLLLLWPSAGRYRPLIAAGLLLGGSLVFLAGAAGPAFAAAAAIAAAIALTTVRVRRPNYLHRVALTLGVLATLALAAIGYYEETLRMIGRDPTLTGRTTMWDLFIELIRARPLLGYGYGGIWRTDSPVATVVLASVSWEPQHAHNAYFELLLALGIGGFAVFIALLAHTLIRAAAWARASDPLPIYATGTILAFVLTHSVVESDLARAGDLVALLFFTLVAALYRRPGPRLDEADAKGSGRAARGGPSETRGTNLRGVNRGRT